MAANKPADCRACGAPIASSPKGRRRRFCSAACKQRWYRRNRQRHGRHPGYVYLITTGTEYKIGVARNVKRRMHTLGLRVYRILHTIRTDHMFRLEHQIHARLAAKRVDHEYFKLDWADIRWFISLGDELPEGVLPEAQRRAA